MPQLDLYTWINQVYWLYLILFVFYYVMAFRYLMESMRVFKVRNKILEYRELATLVMSLQMRNFYNDFVNLFLSVLSNKIYSSVVMNQAASSLVIKTKIFNTTSIAADLEAIYFIHEQLNIAQNLKIIGK